MSRRERGLDPLAERLVQESRARVASPPSGRDRLATLLVGGGFLGTTIPLALLDHSGRSASAGTVILLVLAYAAASRVEFEIGANTVVPSQLVLVPMLFLLPVAWVPLAVAAGLVAGRLPDYATGRAHPARALGHVASGWHAVGPALVFLAAGEPGPALSDWDLYVAALSAQLAFDVASVSLRNWLALGLPLRTEAASIAVAFAVDAALAPIGFVAALAADDTRYAFLFVLPLIALLAGFAHQRRASIDRSVALGAAYRGTAFLLGDFVDRDDAYTGEHSREVVELVVAVADALGLDERDRRDAEFAALLHDVGKMRVPRELINKPGALTSNEREVMDRHTIEGEEMLARVGGLLGDVGEIVRSCHERFDGRGYPDGLGGEEIPLIARIVSCCDAWSAMTADRPYRRALSSETALHELRVQSGRQFDPAVVEALLRVLERQPARA
jgi:putative nucleotidyltransferase with HDIG domain